MPYGTVNADVIGTSVAGSNLGAGNASIMKNRIINGAMVIDQRNAGASVTPTTTTVGYPVDRFFVEVSQNSKLTCQQNAGSVTSPVGFSNYLGVTSSSAYSLTTNDYFVIQQNIEGFNTFDLAWGTANAKTITLSFWVYSSLTGTFGGAIKNHNGTRTYPFTYTVSASNTWEQKAITITGDTAGTWVGAVNSASIKVVFGLGVASNLSATAGSWATGNYLSATGATSVVGTSGATFYITGVQLEVGSSATGFEYRPYTTELQLCQRYLPCFNSTSTTCPVGSGMTDTATTLRAYYPFAVAARTTPTGMTVSSNSHFTFFGAGTGGGTISLGYAGTQGSIINVTTTGATTNAAIIQFSNSTSGQILFTGCEL